MLLQLGNVSQNVGKRNYLESSIATTCCSVCIFVPANPAGQVSGKILLILWLHWTTCDVRKGGGGGGTHQVWYWRGPEAVGMVSLR